jgi:hypothetical protein
VNSTLNVSQLDINEDDLRQRLVYFEERLADAKRMSIAKEPLPAKFSEGFATDRPDRPKTWSDTIKLITERIAGIQDQFRVE